jgi:hypothetical protein
VAGGRCQQRPRKGRSRSGVPSRVPLSAHFRQQRCHPNRRRASGTPLFPYLVL